MIEYDASTKQITRHPATTKAANQEQEQGGRPADAMQQRLDGSGGMEVQFNGDGTASFRRNTVHSFTVDSSLKPATGQITQALNGSRVVTGSQITEKSIINIGGLETSVKAAVTAGLVVQDNQGNYVIVNDDDDDDGGGNGVDDDKPGPKENTNKENTDTKAEQAALDENTEALIGEVLDNVQPSEVSRAVRALSEGKEVDAFTIEQAAAQMGIEPSEAEGKLGAIREAFENQAKDVVAGMGLDADEVFAWAYKNLPHEMAEAIGEHTTNRNTDGYKRIAQEFLMHYDQFYPDDIIRALPPELNPIVINENGKPKILIDTPVGQVSWATAVRQGFIKGVSRD